MLRLPPHWCVELANEKHMSDTRPTTVSKVTNCDTILKYIKKLQ